MTRQALIVRKRGGGERSIEPNKWFVDRNTERGEDADFYERMPHQGRRWIDPRSILRREDRP
jgi:hypothetical protein